MYNDCCYTKDDYNAMCDWNLNPRTGESMSCITDPRGNSIPANVFSQVPKNLYFSDSNYYCCVNSRAVKYDHPVNYLPKDAFFSNSRYCCCMGDAELNYNTSMANSIANYGIAKANNFGCNCCGGY